MEYENNDKTLKTNERVNYKYFRYVQSDVVKDVKRKIKRKHGVKDETIKIPIHTKEYYNEESIERFQLESHAKLLPDMNGNKTIINNYLLRFWGPTFDSRSGGIIAYTYIILLSYCWDKDYTWISLDTIGSQITSSRNTVKKYLTILEEHGFIIRFWREEDNEDRQQGTMLIKVRQTLPFLSREQYNQLPLKLRKEHDRLLSRIKRESNFEFDLSHNYREIYEQLRNEVVDIKKPTGALKEEIENLEEYAGDFTAAQEKMSKNEKEIWNKVLEKLKEKVSKPSFDTFLKNTVAYKDEQDVWLICAPNVFSMDWLETSYKNIIIDAMKNLDIPFTKVEFDLYE